ncbi:hypothetical protein RCL1_007838 [Eukaryota sp. TZLM3-RCL]
MNDRDRWLSSKPFQGFYYRVRDKIGTHDHHPYAGNLTTFNPITIYDNGISGNIYSSSISSVSRIAISEGMRHLFKIIDSYKSTDITLDPTLPDTIDPDTRYMPIENIRRYFKLAGNYSCDRFPLFLDKVAQYEICLLCGNGPTFNTQLKGNYGHCWSCSRRICVQQIKPYSI